MGQNKNRFIKLQNDVQALLIEAVNHPTLFPDEVSDLVSRIITTVIEATNDRPSSLYDRTKSQLGTMRND